MTLMHHKKYVKLAPNDYEVWSEWTLDYKQYEYPNDYEKVKKLIIDNLEEKLVPEKFRELNKQNKLFGHCYHATQALYYFFVDAKLKIMSASCEGPAEHHWWLQDVDNNILDVTAEQYDAFDYDPPYQKGKESKWYGWKNRPHRKTQKLMNKIQQESKLYFQQYLDRPKKVY